MIWWHAETCDQLQEAYNLLPPHQAWAARWSRSGRTWRCTGPPSSTARTSRRSSPTRRRATTSASTPSCAPTTGTCCPTRTAAGMLADHGKMARGYPDVRANTVAVVLARRLRVAPRLRGRRAAPHRRPHAPPARLGGPDARPRGGPVLHRPPQGSRRAGRRARLGLPARPTPAGTRRARRVSACPPCPSGRLQRSGGCGRPGSSASAPGAARRRRAAPGGGPRADRRPGSASTHGLPPPATPWVPASRSVSRTEPASRRRISSAPVVRRRRVPLGGQDQHRRQLTRPGPHVEGPLPGGAASRRTAGSSRRCPRSRTAPPARARVLSRSQTFQSVGQGASLHSTARVDGVAVLALSAAVSALGAASSDQRLRIALQIRRQRLGPARPEVVVVPGRQERAPAAARARPSRPPAPGQAAPAPARSCAVPPGRRPRAGTRRRAGRSTPGSPPSASRTRPTGRGCRGTRSGSGAGFTAESKHHPPYVRGEQRRVHRPEVGAVRGAHERRACRSPSAARRTSRSRALFSEL